MNCKLSIIAAAGAMFVTNSVAFAGSPTYFKPLTESAPVTSPNSTEEFDAPWVTPKNARQEDLTSLSEVEDDMVQSLIRVPGLGSGASMFDMVSFDPTGKYIFIPHETSVGAGVSRYSIEDDEAVVLFGGDLGGLENDWSNDYAAFDPSTFTPNGTVLLGEEWSGEGRIIEVLNPFADPADIQIRELQSIANVAHEGLRFSTDGRALYFVDEWNSGSIYKFVTAAPGDYTRGQTFVLNVDAYAGNAADDYDEPSNADEPRVGPATWIPITDENGVALTSVDPFRNGPTNDPRTAADTRGGRPAADEVGATPYGRPEDMEIGHLANGNEVMYFTATSENAVYAVEFLSDTEAYVRLAASETVTPKNLGFAPTTGVLNSPDNLAQDALGNIYIIEDAPNGSSTGGDIWFMRDVDSDGVAESLDHFMSIRAAGSEATGMIFNPRHRSQFVVAVQHPTSTDLDAVSGGFGDALWVFDVKSIPAPCPWTDKACNERLQFMKQLQRADAAKKAKKAKK